MTDQLETEVRAALRERAAQVPTASIARLAHFDYHPRTRRLRPPLAIGALATAAGAGTVAVIVSLTAGASNAFAGWTPTPTTPSPGQLANAQASCEGGQSPIAGLPLKLADTRGPFTFSVYASDTSSATCISGPSFRSVSGSTASAPIDVAAGRILLSTHESSRGGSAYSFADGRTGDGVSAVTLVLDDGTKVQATVDNGWFVAWWPSAHAVTSAAITTPAGVTTQTVPAVTIPGGGPGAGGGSVSGFSSGSGEATGGGGTVGRESVQSFSSSQ